MIEEKALGKRAVHYADGVVSALKRNGRSNARWDTVNGLIEAAYFNGFQSGIVWQKQAQRLEDEKPFKVQLVPVDIGGGRTSNVESAVSIDGHYIGSPGEARNLWKKFGITKFELRTKKSQVCSVGYSPAKKQWFGWSHRAIKGFKTRKEAAKFAESVS